MGRLGRLGLQKLAASWSGGAGSDNWAGSGGSPILSSSSAFRNSLPSLTPSSAFGQVNRSGRPPQTPQQQSRQPSNIGYGRPNPTTMRGSFNNEQGNFVAEGLGADSRMYVDQNTTPEQYRRFQDRALISHNDYLRQRQARREAARDRRAADTAPDIAAAPTTPPEESAAPQTRGEGEAAGAAETDIATNQGQEGSTPGAALADPTSFNTGNRAATLPGWGSPSRAATPTSELANFQYNPETVQNRVNPMQVTASAIKLGSNTDADGYTPAGITRNVGANAPGKGLPVPTQSPEQSTQAATNAIGKGVMRQAAGNAAPVAAAGATGVAKTAEVCGRSLLTKKRRTGRSMLSHALKGITSDRAK